MELWGLEGTLSTLNTKKGRGACWSSGMGLKRGTSFSYSLEPASNQPNKLVSSHFGTPLVLGPATATLDSQDSPRPGLGGSHHLPPYSILCVTSWHPHPNGFLSRDSQGGVPKLSQFGLSGLCEFITLCSNLRLGWGLKQTCISPWELFNDELHSMCTHRGWVDSRLLVVGSQIVNLTPDPSFFHNLFCKCPNGSCEAILDTYTSIAFQWHKERLKVKCFDPCNRTLKFQESRRIPKSPFREWECHPHTLPKVGLPQQSYNIHLFCYNFKKSELAKKNHFISLIWKKKMISKFESMKNWFKSFFLNFE